MSVRITSEALDIVRRSLELAKLDPAEAGVRLREAGGQVMPRFAREPEPTDEVVEADGLRLFVERQLVERYADAEIAVSDEHERLILRAI